METFMCVLGQTSLLPMADIGQCRSIGSLSMQVNCVLHLLNHICARKKVKWAVLSTPSGARCHVFDCFDSFKVTVYCLWDRI